MSQLGTYEVFNIKGDKYRDHVYISYYLPWNVGYFPEVHGITSC